mgnify:CR=1 FL=1
MSPRTGRPKAENPKATQVSVRLDQSTIDKLEYCMNKLNMTKAETLRAGIEAIYAGIKK